MPSFRKSSHLERILGLADRLDEVNLNVLMNRLARERALLEAVFNTVQEGIIVIDQDGVVRYANASAGTLIGLKDDDIGAAPIWKLMPELARTLKLRSDRGGIRPTSISRELEVHYPEQRHLRVYLVPFDNPEQRPEEADYPTDHYALIIGDVTEERISQEERIESEKLSSIFDLAAGVAHEIGNPLNSINIHLQLLKRGLNKLEADESTHERLRRSLEICVNEVQRLDGIITHFLHAIRPTPLDLQDIDLITVLSETLNIQAEELQNLNIDVTIDLNDPLPIIAGDRNQIKQVFFNVIKNAMEAMGQNGALTITEGEDDEFVYLYFADDGQGIAQEDLAKVFQPYHTSKKSGHGLGMMVCQRIMRDHHGSIGLDSRPGTGTIVTLQFPKKSKRMRMLQTGTSE